MRHLVTARNRCRPRRRVTRDCWCALLAADPYDEQAHRLLVRMLTRTGRHGEARRAYERWADAMRAIDAPLPDRGVLRAPDTPGSPDARSARCDATRPPGGTVDHQHPSDGPAAWSAAKLKEN